MKNNLALLTGIGMAIAFLVAGGCSTADDNDDPTEENDKVTLYLKAEGEGMDMTLLISDSKDGAGSDAGQHVADVGPGTRVVWRRASNSGIKKFIRIGPVDRGEIMPEDASTILLQKRYRHRVPDKDIAPYTQEKYIIKYIPQGSNDEKSVDPYLRIRDTDQSNPGRP